MARWLRQSTAFTLKMGPFLDSGDGSTAETGLTISQGDVRVTKNAGDFAQKGNASAAVHDENGYYDVPFAAADSNTLGRLKIAVHEAGALAVWDDFMVVPQQVWDSFFGADRLQVDLREKSDSTVGLTTQEKTDINNEVSGVLNTAIPASPVASSVFERVAAIDDKLPTGTISDFDESANNVIVGTNNDKTGYSLSADQSGVTIGTVNALGTQAKTDVKTKCTSSLVGIDLDHLINDKTSVPTPASGTLFDQIMSKDGGQTFSQSTDSLEAIRDTTPLGTAMRGTDNAALATGVKLSASGTAQVNAEIVDGLQTDTITEPGDMSTDLSLFGLAWHIYHANCTQMTVDKSASPETLKHYNIAATSAVKSFDLTDSVSTAQRA